MASDAPERASEKASDAISVAMESANAAPVSKLVASSDAATSNPAGTTKRGYLKAGLAFGVPVGR